MKEIIQQGFTETDSNFKERVKKFVNEKTEEGFVVSFEKIWDSNCYEVTYEKESPVPQVVLNEDNKQLSSIYNDDWNFILGLSTQDMLSKFTELSTLIFNKFSDENLDFSRFTKSYEKAFENHCIYADQKYKLIQEKLEAEFK